MMTKIFNNWIKKLLLKLLPIERVYVINKSNSGECM